MLQACSPKENLLASVLANGTDKLLISDLVDVVDDVMIVGGVISVCGMQVCMVVNDFEQ